MTRGYEDDSFAARGSRSRNSAADAPLRAASTAEPLNSVPQLVELRTRIQRSNEPDKNPTLNVDLRAGSAEIELHGAVVDVCILEMLLYVDLVGLDVAIGPRFGEREIHNEIVVTEKVSSTKKASGSVSGSAALSIDPSRISASATAGVGGKAETEAEITSASETSSSFFSVEALAGKMWKVSERTKMPLKGPYMNGQALCSLEAKHGANQMTATTRACVKQRDLQFSPLSRISWLANKNKEKLIGVLISKCLSTHKESYNGMVCLSECETEHEK